MAKVTCPNCGSVVGREDIRSKSAKGPLGGQRLVFCVCCDPSLPVTLGTRVGLVRQLKEAEYELLGYGEVVQVQQTEVSDRGGFTKQLNWKFQLDDGREFEDHPDGDLVWDRETAIRGFYQTHSNLFK